MRLWTVRRVTATVAAAVAVVSGAGCAAGQDQGPAGGSHWRTVFSDDFDGNSLDRAKWNTCYYWADHGCTIVTNHEMEWYLPSGVSVSHGALHLTARRDPVDASNGHTYPYRSGMVSTGPAEEGGKPRFAFTYGRVEARIRVPAGTGLWAAFWLLPVTGESLPEIDLIEVLGNDTSKMLMHLHPLADVADTSGKTHVMPEGSSFSDGWRDIALDWRPGVLTYFVDGRRVWQLTGEQVPHQRMYLIANLAVGGDYPGPPDAGTRFPATYQVDYVRVRERAR